MASIGTHFGRTAYRKNKVNLYERTLTNQLREYEENRKQKAEST